jgi:DUF971 family protein
VLGLRFSKIWAFTVQIVSDQVIFGRRHVGIMSAESVGNYGIRWGSYSMACVSHVVWRRELAVKPPPVGNRWFHVCVKDYSSSSFGQSTRLILDKLWFVCRILFDDLHKTGIFTWDYLHHLGSNKFSLMRNYIRTLRKHGLSRDPQPRKWWN